MGGQVAKSRHARADGGGRGNRKAEDFDRSLDFLAGGGGRPTGAAAARTEALIAAWRAGFGAMGAGGWAAAGGGTGAPASALGSKLLMLVSAASCSG